MDKLFVTTIFIEPPRTQWDVGIGPKILPVRFLTRTTVARIPLRLSWVKAETKK